LAVHEPPLGLPFVDETFYVARPWVEWLILTQANLVDIENGTGGIPAQIAINTAAIAVNAAAITVNSEDIVALEAADVILTNSVLSNEALSYYFSSI